MLFIIGCFVTLAILAWLVMLFSGAAAREEHANTYYPQPDGTPTDRTGLW